MQNLVMELEVLVVHTPLLKQKYPQVQGVWTKSWPNIIFWKYASKGC